MSEKIGTMMSLFSGSGSFEYIAEKLGIEPKYNAEVEPYPIKVTTSRFPNTTMLGDVSEIKGSEIEPVDLITFGSPCFAAGTLIKTKSGYIPIEDVKIGDVVFTHKSQWKKVIETMTNPTNHIYDMDFGVTEIMVTENHPLFVKESEEAEPIWKEVKDIKTTDLVAYEALNHDESVFIWKHFVLKEKRNYAGVVYNIEVEDDHSYIANGIVSHNCQSLSTAGKREGIRHGDLGDDEVTASGLFMEAMRIIREMREATDGKYPTFIIWENVLGALSSSDGEDFRTVLEEIESIAAGKRVSVPRPPESWSSRGSILAERYSIAWRTLDAQYWGVPQRRKRIYLVADFGGQRAEQILFEREGLLGDITQSGEKE